MGSGERRPYRCTLLIDALRLLPVHPLTERDELGQARYQALRQGSGEVHGTAVSLEDLQELFVQGDDGHPRISREGACVLLELYQEGCWKSLGTKLLKAAWNYCRPTPKVEPRSLDGGTGQSRAGRGREK